MKPRLPKEMMFFEHHYQQPLDQDKLNEYDAQVAQYYQPRSHLDFNWSKNIIQSLNKPIRPHILDLLDQQGFIKEINYKQSMQIFF